MASKKMKYASIAGVGLLTMSLVACGTEQQPVTLGDKMTESGIKKIEDTPIAEKCANPELQDDGSYKCEKPSDTSGSGGTSFVPFWFFNGQTYGSHSAMVNSSDYKANNLVSGTKNPLSKSNIPKSNTNSSKSNSSSKSGVKSGGFGSGGRGSSGGS